MTLKIILAGPDGVGKTTLGERLAEELGYTFVTGNSYKTKNKLDRARGLAGLDNAVFDRFFFPDHLVYSKVKNQQVDRAEYSEWISLSEDLAQDNTIILYIDAPDNALRGRLERRGDDYIEWGEIDAIREAYEDLFREIEIPIIRLESLDGFEYRLGDCRGRERVIDD